MKPSQMPADQAQTLDDLLLAKVNSIISAMDYLNARRGKDNCTDAERAQINSKLADLNTQLGLVELQIKAEDADTLDVINPPTQADVTNVTNLATQVDALDRTQAIAAATWTLIGNAMTVAEPLLTA